MCGLRNEVATKLNLVVFSWRSRDRGCQPGCQWAGFEGRETGSGSILKTETNEYRTGALIAAWNSVKKFMTRWRNG